MTDIKLSGGVHITQDAFDALHRLSVEFRRVLRECSIELARKEADSFPLITTELVHSAVESACRNTMAATQQATDGDQDQGDRKKVA